MSLTRLRFENCKRLLRYVELSVTLHVLVSECFVRQENAEKPKKRPGLSRQSSFSDEHVEEVSAKKVKKERSPRAPKPGKNGAVVGAVTSVAGPVSLIPFPSNEQREDGDHAVDPADLLFSCDSFEDMHGEREDDDGGSSYFLSLVKFLLLLI